MSKLEEWLDTVCGGNRPQRPVTSSSNLKTVQECAEAHKDKPCFREANGQPLCKDCPKRVKTK